MTTVVALARDGAVYMAADTLTNVYERPIVNGARKIVRIPAGDGEVLIGVCGSGALAGTIRHSLKIDGQPADGEDPAEWAHTVAVAVTELATTHGLLCNGQLDGTLILGWRGRLWTLTHAQAIPHDDGIAAIGSGEGPAIGAVDALLLSHPPSPSLVAQAVNIGIARDKHSSAPVQIEVLV